MPSKAELICIDPKRVHEFWPHVKLLIHRAIIRGGGDFMQVKHDVLIGLDLLWIAYDGKQIIAAAITSLGVLGGKKTCTIVACGGVGWKRFGHLIEGIENYAIGENCTAMRIYGRTGWQRLLKDYDVLRVVLEKEL